MMFKYMCLVLFITWYQLADCHPASSSVKSLDSMVEKESEAFLSVEAEDSSHKNVRDKRTIGFLRQLFPNLSKIVDQKIQQITRFVFRIIGRLVLRGAGGGAGAGAGAGGTAAAGTGSEAGGNGGRRISITLPTFPPSTDDDDEESQTELPAANASPTSASDADALASRIAEPASPEIAAIDSSSAASVDSAVAANSAVEVAVTTVVPATTSAPETTTAAAPAAAEAAAAPVANAAPAAGTTTTTVAAAIAAAATTTVNAITTSSPTTQMPLDSENTVGTGIVKRTARDVSTDNSSSTNKRSPLTDTDNEVSSDNALSSNAEDDAQAETVADEDPRNKRFLFNLRGGAGGGSGNFLFDLIRLIAGSGANQDKDESTDSVPAEGEAQEVHADVNAKEDGYSVGVPGPLTRIFVIANRGVANLVQDLILRLAQTTERIVNFKARLITSLI
ncbi:homeotic protein female sterile-like isoform X2 [Melanaphis sacchari]|uniref:homeotic protein female sterile-like isoform X2 n=1 Tax=Melanaphis sacchari TaxID=742174 RepID=UPI000DC133CF|nr:homeotic protein female sterile-like isoform X2 [Melanaphis sacchari]